MNQKLIDYNQTMTGYLIKRQYEAKTHYFRQKYAELLDKMPSKLAKMYLKEKR